MAAWLFSKCHQRRAGVTQLAVPVSRYAFAESTPTVSASAASNGSSSSTALAMESPVATWELGHEFKSGFAVSSDGTTMAASFPDLHQIRVYRTVPEFEELRRFGQLGASPCEFTYPQRLCFTDTGTLLVCDYGNHRVQHLSIAGEHLSSLTVDGPMSVAVHGMTVAVGTSNGTIELHDLETAELIRRFGSNGDGPGQIGVCATGIRFSANGDYLVAVEADNSRVSHFTTFGIFVKHSGIGLFAQDDDKDVCFGGSAEILVADCNHHRICMFSPDGDTLVKMWGSQGSSGIALFEHPKALAVVGACLYILDDTRVQVFQ